MMRIEENISGWLYNPGYRDTGDYLLNVDKAPGVGTGLRELYNLGLGKAPTSTMSILKKLVRRYL